MDNCIFCKIINKEIPKEFVLENENIVSFNDIHPKAPVHILVVLKKHVSSVQELDSKEAAGEMILTAREIAKSKNLAGYKLVFNVGREGGQIVDHIHLHILGGWGNNPLKVAEV